MTLSLYSTYKAWKRDKAAEAPHMKTTASKGPRPGLPSHAGPPSVAGPMLSVRP